MRSAIVNIKELGRSGAGSYHWIPLGEYEKMLKEIGALDFDDLLIKTVVLFKEVPQILAKWQQQLTHIFVDEWQDTNKIQYTLTRLLVGKNNNITAVGDASQSIYSWRGAGGPRQARETAHANAEN